MPSRLAVVCALIVGVQIAHAERRPVAVIDVAGDPATTKLAADLNPVLINHPDLAPIANSSVVNALYGEFVDDNMKAIEDAETSRKTAEQRLAAYDFPIAEQSAKNGEADLEKATPSAQSIRLFAQLAFLRGQALLGKRGGANEARESFALAHRLDPSFVPDAARYLPDVVQAFNAAKAHWSGIGKLEVVGTGRLWIDGKDEGAAPATIEVAAGPHVVWLTGADRVTGNGRIVVEAGKQAKLEIKNEPADLRLKVRRARAALRYADPTARATVMKQIAELVGVRDAVLITSVNSKIIVQTWCEGACSGKLQGFSALRELQDRKPIDLLTPLAPPKPKKEEVPDPGTKKVVVDDREWYEKRPYQAGIVAGVLAAIIGSYFIYQTLTDDTVTASGDFDMTESAVLRW